MQYTISIKSLDKRDAVLFESMLQLIHMQLDAEWCVSDTAKIIVVDTDKQEGEHFCINNNISSDNTQIIISYAKTNQLDTKYHLSKPLRVQPLIKLLNTIVALETTAVRAEEIAITQDKNPLQQRLSSAFSHALKKRAAKKQESNTIHDTSSSATIKIEKNNEHTFEPQKYLIGVLQNAIKMQKVQRIGCSGLPSIYICPAKQVCFTDNIMIGQLSSSQKMLYSTLVEHLEIEDITQEAVSDIVTQNKLQHYPIDTLLWLATLQASQGRLLNSLTQEDNFYLQQWPNFATLPPQPVHMNLSAFMLKNKANLSTIAEKTNTSVIETINFVNACYLVNLLHTTTESSIQNKTLSHPKRQIFQSILKRLLN